MECIIGFAWYQMRCWGGHQVWERQVENSITDAQKLSLLLQKRAHSWGIFSIAKLSSRPRIACRKHGHRAGSRCF